MSAQSRSMSSASAPPDNSTNSFIELYNAGAREADISNWALTEHSNLQAIFSAVKIPAGTKLAPRGFYLLGLSDSGLAVPARSGDATIHVRSTTGMSAGDTITIDNGSGVETRKIATRRDFRGQPHDIVATPPRRSRDDGPRGSTNVPLASVAGFVAGEKIAMGYGATFPP